MTIRNTLDSYGSVNKTLHWLIAILLLIMLICGYFMEDIPKAYAGLVYNTHKVTGVTILFLMLLRIVWACVNPKPLLPLNTRSWERWLERAVHYSLYAFVLAMPLAGWIGASASGRGPRIGETVLNLPVPRDKALSHASFDMHNSIAIVLIVLISLHVLAALYHYFIRKDNVLQRMMP